MKVVAFDFSQDFTGVRVLMRSALNAPIERGVVTNTYRIYESIKTIRKLAHGGAKTVVCGHIGRKATDSLLPVWEILKKEIGPSVLFASDVIGKDAQTKVANLKNGEVLLLENTRREPGETNNDYSFAQKLSSFGDVYINDAFADSHRSHASIIGVPTFLKHFAGPHFIQEMEGIAPAQHPPSPSFAIIGGAKFLTKEPLIQTLLDRYDQVFIGGALANDFFAAQGHEVGRSLVSFNTNAKEFLINSKLLLPSDVVIDSPEGKVVREVDEIEPRDMVLDVGPKTIQALKAHIEKSRFILWNGPLGNFEKGFSEGTEEVAKYVAAAKATSVIGGGDTIAAIENLQIRTHFTHVSTAGGAMLQFIADGTLPGIEALKESS